jgi:hypothetical protein
VLYQGAVLSPSGIVMPKTAGVGIKVDQAVATFPWRDMEGQVRMDPAGVDAPQLSNLISTVRAYSFAAADKIDSAFHIPHDYLPGSDLFIHIHWTHNGATITGNFQAALRYSYAKGHNQANFGAMKTQDILYATVNIATTPALRHRVDEIQLSSNGGSVTLLDSAQIEVDGLLVVSLEQLAIPTITGGAPNEPFILAVDLHYQTTNVGTKQKSPPFWT